jgi:DNA mismatch repair protein MutL
MDQHAAHEKVMYEKLMKQYQDRTIVSQQVAPPIVISVNPRQIEVLQEYHKLFEDMGFQMESFGGKEYMLRAVPLETYGLAAQDIFIDFIDSLMEENHLNIDLFIYRIATMACKAAVKGNMSLSFQEADALIDQLLQLENPYNCPHGRPTIITMTETEIEKKFKQIQDR